MNNEECIMDGQIISYLSKILVLNKMVRKPGISPMFSKEPCSYLKYINTVRKGLNYLFKDDTEDYFGVPCSVETQITVVSLIYITRLAEHYYIKEDPGFVNYFLLVAWLLKSIWRMIHMIIVLFLGCLN